jgi:hypothetical protein
LSPALQLDLFTPRDSAEARQLDDAVDRIHTRFGDDAIRRGTDR